MNPPSNTVLALESLKVFVGLFIIFPELSDDILAHIAVILFNLARNLEMVFRRNGRHLAPLSHQVKHELRNVTPSDGNVLDSTPNDITFGTGDNMSYTVAGVDNCARQSTINDTVGGPGCGKGKHSLHGDV